MVFRSQERGKNDESTGAKTNLFGLLALTENTLYIHY